MQYLTFAIASAFALAFGASAQMPNVPQCLMKCFDDSAKTAGCSSSMDLQCVCTNEEFTKAAITCVLMQCNAEEQNTASTLSQQFCGSLAGNSTSTVSGTATGTSTSAPAASSSAGSGTNAGFVESANVGLLVAGLGMTLFSL
ncbi:CFEM domain protein [Rhizoctonia solani]|uniref:CFEM domain protein n=1 Tax=Rhizoctonia solani TaxID=456999 RepID=A0A8H8T136_9AGAM|nr:CFEM domain protein [Rhizoctonia solani]QRW25394.1 CFEM domain protein [Rhizoctonia solani]